ncbi:MAG: hypothetical protein LBM93_03405 [Oscillospiraceae bacterium]|nr:hypothetical protein [Oscillospiraceae bacterium]
MDKIENFVLHSEFSDKLDAFNQKFIDTTFSVNEALGPAGLDSIEVLDTIYPSLEQIAETPNSVISEKLKDVGESFGQAMNNMSGNNYIQKEIESSLTPKEIEYDLD